MIFGHIKETKYLDIYPEPLRSALNFLETHDINDMLEGEYELRGRDIFVKIAEVETKPLGETRPESHEEYIDVQFVGTGEEKLGYMVMGEPDVSERRDKDDLIFYQEAIDENFVEARAGNFTIFFPGEVHRPCVAVKEPLKIKKAIVKVRASLVLG